jgi:hypothetical protein
MEVAKRGKHFNLQTISVFVCFDLCFTTLDVPNMNSKVRMQVLCLLFYVVCINVFICFVWLFFMTNMVLQKMIDNADYVEVRIVFGRMDLRKKDFDPTTSICQAK